MWKVCMVSQIQRETSDKDDWSEAYTSYCQERVTRSLYLSYKTLDSILSRVSLFLEWVSGDLKEALSSNTKSKENNIQLNCHTSYIFAE